MMKLLQQSARTKLGAWTIEKSDKGDYLVIYLCKVDATASARSLKSTMEYVAKLTNLAKKDLEPEKTKQDSSALLAEWLSE